jgi:nucleoid-associated protein YejK
MQDLKKFTGAGRGLDIKTHTELLADPQSFLLFSGEWLK